MKKATDRYRGVLKKLWDIYDADRNGELDPEESKKLMQGFFKVQMNNFKIHSRDQFLRAATSVIPPEIPGYEQVVTKITKHADKIPELLEKMFPEYVTEESYVKVLKELDEDGDGKIDKKEFLSKFFEAQEQAINLAELSMELTMELMPGVQEDIMSALLSDENGTNMAAMLSSDDESSNNEE
mmetsp:Transcript_27451/g.44198  ORF Transcript_27451/g.44198 Transcript_27451/m.44198 type:complete len:183 (-) Transcript_27451:247-795(-)